MSPDLHLLDHLVEIFGVCEVGAGLGDDFQFSLGLENVDCFGDALAANANGTHHLDP